MGFLYVFLINPLKNSLWAASYCPIKGKACYYKEWIRKTLLHVGEPLSTLSSFSSVFCSNGKCLHVFLFTPVTVILPFTPQSTRLTPISVTDTWLWLYLGTQQYYTTTCVCVQAGTFLHYNILSECRCSDNEDAVPYFIYINTTCTHVHLPSLGWSKPCALVVYFLGCI